MELTGSVQGMIDLMGGGSDVEVTQVLTSGEKIAIISVDNVPTDIYAPDGGSDVEVTQVVSSGTKIATISVNGDSTDIYAPSPTAPTEVEVSQVVSSGTKIATISVDGEATDIYAPNSGGGGGITYSTSEVDTGDKWTDGKSIYAIVYYFSNPYSISSTWTNTSINTSNIGRLIEIECMHADGSHYGVDGDITRNGHTVLGIRTPIGANVACILLKYTHRN